MARARDDAEMICGYLRWSVRALDRELKTAPNEVEFNLVHADSRPTLSEVIVGLDALASVSLWRFSQLARAVLIHVANDDSIAAALVGRGLIEGAACAAAEGQKLLDLAQEDVSIAELSEKLWEVGSDSLMGTRQTAFVESGRYSSRVNIMTRIERATKLWDTDQVANYYAVLSDASHPAIESVGSFVSATSREGARTRVLLARDARSINEVSSIAVWSLALLTRPTLYSVDEMRFSARKLLARAFTEKADLDEALVKQQTPGRNDPCLCGSGAKSKNCAHEFVNRWPSGQEGSTFESWKRALDAQNINQTRQ